MGIRNLAYCAIEHGEKWNVTSWDNVDLLEDGKSAQDAKKCGACNAAAKWCGEGIKWCNACATGVRRKKSASRIPTLPTLPSSASGVKGLRALAADMPNSKKAKKEDLISWLSERYLMPWKPEKAGNVSLQVIVRKMDTWLDSVLPTLSLASLIRLENQPVMKGPTMKSVQIMLFTLLTHRLTKEYDWKGDIEFVHAGVKTRGAAPAPAQAAVGGAGSAADGPSKDSEAYRLRKQTAESEVERILTERGADVSSWLTFFKSRTKKSDLADAFLMALRS